MVVGIPVYFWGIFKGEHVRDKGECKKIALENPFFNRKYIFIHGGFSLVMLVLGSLTSIDLVVSPTEAPKATPKPSETSLEEATFGSKPLVVFLGVVVKIGLAWAAFIWVFPSMVGFPPHFTPQNGHFLVGKPMGFVGETHHF